MKSYNSYNPEENMWMQSHMISKNYRCCTVSRDNINDIPKKYIGYCYQQTSNNPMYEFCNHVYSWLQDEHSVRFEHIRDSRSGYFQDPPVMYIYKYHLVITQRIGFDE